ncbi:hypothetical protein EBS67_00455 [bacterium]|nr:hypothetical protein [bacterium]NBT60220.1 hypothetical protein [Planctomycetia bacterium]
MIWESWIPAIIAAISGGIIGVLGKTLGSAAVAFVRGLFTKKIIEDKLALDERKLISDQFALLLHQSELYRQEVRRDIEKLREENIAHQKDCNERIELLRRDAEYKMELMNTTIISLTKDLEIYRNQTEILIQFIEDNGLQSPIVLRSE